MVEISDAERRARAAAEIAREHDEPQHGLYYSSFVDTDRPEGEQWLGGCFVEADGPVHSLQVAHLQGCNPGGAAATWGPFPVDAVAERHRNRLLAGEEGRQLLSGGPLTD